MSFVIAFFRHSSTADVVPASAVNGEVRRGVTTKVRWGGRAYIAKILYVGPRELCESKVGLVTADGELTDEPFDIVPFEDSVTNEHTAVRPETPTAAERESVLQLRTIQEKLATAVELLNKSLKNDKKEELRAERIEKMLAEVLNRLPAPSQASTRSSKSYSPRTRRSKSSTQSKRKAKQRQERDVEQNLVNMVEERRKIWQFWRNVNVAPLTQFFLTVDPLAWSVFSLVACGFVKIMFACFIFSMLLHSHDAPLVYLTCFLIIHIISLFATLEMLLIQKKKMLLICGSVDAAVIVVMIIVLTLISSTKNGADIVPVERVAGITVVVAFTEILLIVRYYYMRYRAPIQNKACPPSIPPGCPPSLPCSRTQSSKTPGNGSKSDKCNSSLLYSNHDKWIVLTTWNEKTKAIRNLTTVQNWQVAVVREPSAAENFANHAHNMHFVNASIAFKLGLVFTFDDENSRRNIGYLYAIKNGAKYIYDGDENLHLYGQISNAFDFSTHASGLWHYGNGNSVRERIFRPYQFYGLRSTELRAQNAHHSKSRQCLCPGKPPPVVQHAILQVKQRKYAGSKEIYAEINKFSPPVMVAPGIYSLWQNENTLFSYDALFVIFRPSIANNRTGTIFSLYVQKVIHMIGGNVGFYPTDAVKDVDESSSYSPLENRLDWSEIYATISLLDSFSCTEFRIEVCMLRLAKALRYNFPKVKSANWNFTSQHGVELCGKCRRVSLEFAPFMNARYHSPIDDNVVLRRAEAKLEACESLRNWCSGTDMFFRCDAASPKYLAEAHRNRRGLESIRDTVLVVTHNYPRYSGMGLLQQLYQPYFGITIFCGTWYPLLYKDKNGEFPEMISPFNFINMTENEVSNGYFVYNCLSLVRDIRLRNVKGYFMLADDAIFNFWNELQLDEMLFTAWVKCFVEQLNSYWWKTAAGKPSAKRAHKLFTEKYKHDTKVQSVWSCYKEGLRVNGFGDRADVHIRLDTAWKMSDFYFVPEKRMEYVTRVLDVFHEALLFQEIAMNKLLHSMAFRWLKDGSYKYLWKRQRLRWFEYYHDRLTFLHPIKISAFNQTYERMVYAH
ncbi:hypothetical protein Q1695_013010 [Nippostrongylus brasiliensis]|nr:hypothetical protein Q1695_013010 [Nippostrongylus brasiliensis]